MSKYRKKPVVIDAMQFDGAPQDIVAWAKGLDPETAMALEYGVDFIDIPTLEGVMTASKDDWIIRGVQGEFYPCKPDIFEQTYELV